jgi:TP901 family phage tail tape measure protein
MADYKVDVDVNVNDSKLDELESRIKSIQDKTVKVNVKADTKEISNAVSTATKTMQGSGKTIKIKPVVDTSAFSAINKTVTTLNKDNTITVKTTGIETGLDGVKRLRTEVRTLDSEGKQLDFKVSVQDDELLKTKTDAQMLIEELKQIDTIKMKVDTGDISNQVDKIESDFRKITNVTKETQSAMDDFKSAQSLLNEARTSGNNKELISGMEQYETALKKVKNQIDINTRAQKEQASASKLMSDKQTFSLQMTKWLKDNSAAAEDFGGKIQKLQAELQSCDSVRFSNIKSEFKQLTMQADISGKTGLTFADKFKQQFSKLSSYVSAASVIMTGIQIAKSSFQNVLDIDTQMTELKRVTDLSASQYTNIYDNLTASAQKYGVQLTDLISATADWSRAGFDADTASGLAEITSVYQHIADLDYDTSAENLLTAYKGFQSELTSVYGDSQQGVLDAVSHISDVYNEIDNNYATTAADIGEAIKRSASALSVAGNSLEETAGMVTGITEVTQDPEKAGNALKVISMRIRGMSGGLQDLGEEVDDNVTNISKMQGDILNLTHGKVNIFDDAGNFKSTYEILQGIAGVWKELSSTDQADLLETMAGKHRANDLAAILNNWERVEAATKSAYNSTGSAMKEQEKYADSLQGRLNSLQATWQQLSNTFISSGLAKGAVTIFKDLLAVIDKIISTMGGFGTAGLVGVLFAGFKKRSGVSKLVSQFFTDLSEGFDTNLTKLETFDIALAKAGGTLKNFFKTPTGVMTGIGLAIAAVSAAIQFAEDKIAEANKARQEKFDASNNFNDSFDSFEQAYIKYSDKTILSADEENELTSAINGTIDALGNKSAALRDVAGASSDYVSNLNDIAKAELKQQNQLATDAQKAAKDKIKDSFSEGTIKGLADVFNGVGKYDFLLPSKNSKEWDAIQDITTSKSFTKHIENKSSGRAFGLDDDFSKKFNFDADTNLDGYIEQLNYANEIVDKLNAKAQETNDDSYLDSTVYKQASSAVENLSSDLGEYIKQTYSVEKASYQLKNGIPKTTDEFYKMQEAVLKASSSTVTGRQEILDLLNKDYADTFDLSSVESQLKQFQALTNGIKSINKDKENKFEALIDLKTKVNNGDCSVGDYTKAVDEANNAINEIAKKDYNTANALRVQLGIEVDSKGNVDDEVVKLKNKFVKALTKNNVEKEVAESFTNKLSKTELEAAVELSATGEIDLKNIDTKNLDKSIKQKIQDYAKYLEATRFTLNIETETEDLKDLNTALSESRAATGLTQESIENIKKRYKGLDGYNPAAIFEKTTTGVRLNTKALQSLEKQYVATNKAANDQKLGAFAKRYKEIEALREKEKSGSDKYKDYTKQLEDLNNEIEAAKMAAAAYDGLTSSYNEWLNAKSNGQAGDMYDEILDGAKSVKELAKAGKWGNTELQSYIEMFSAPDSLDNATPEQYAAAWGNAISKSNRYFQEGTAGIDAFISDVAAANSNLVKMNDQGVWEIQPNFDVKDWAKAAGVAESTVESIFGQMEEYGFDVPIGIEETSIDDLVAKAESASSALKSSMGQDFDIKVNTDVSSTKEASSEIDNLKKQRDDINNSSATVEVKEQGVEAVNSAIEAVINKQIELEQPTYMQLDTSQVKSTMTDALTALQNYQNAVDEVKSLEMQQDAGIEIDTSQLDDAKKKVDETAEAIAKLDGKQKVAIGLEASDSVDDVKKKIENGKVKLTVDTDVNKSATQELASNLEKIKDKDVTVTVKVKGLDDVKTLNKQINIAAKVDGAVKDLTAFADAAKQLKGVEDKSVTISANLNGNIGSSSDLINNLPSFASTAKTLQDVKDKSVTVTASVGGNITIDNVSTLSKFGSVISSLPPSKTVTVNTNVDTGAIANVKSTLQGLSDSGLMHNYTATITVNTNVDTSAVDNYSPADKPGKVTYEVDASKVNSWPVPPKTGTVTYNPSVTALTDSQLHKTGTITYKATVEGAPVVNGTAHANGTAGHAFKNGDWSTKDSGTALMGELGQELIVRDGRFFTVGDNGAEFVPYKKGDIIFNHKQTEELFKNGYVTSGGGRGVAMANGTAFANVGHGTWKPGGIGGGYSGGGSSSSRSKSSSNSSSNSNSNSNANKEAEKTEETLDWIETALDRVERAISRLDKTATSTYKNWTKRGTALNDQISQTRREIDLQNQAYNRYIQQANSVGLDAGYAAKVRDGTIDIEKITDEDLNNKISEYKQWYEKALDCLDAIDDLRESESKLYEQRFENVSTKYDGYLGVIQHEKDMLDEFVSQTETAGYITSGKYYDAMSANAKKQQEELKKQRDEMISELNNAVNSGTIEKYSESWYSMVNSVDEVTKSIEECNTSLLEYEKNLRELDWQIFDLIQDKISKVADESEFLINLMSNKKLYEDNGQLTDEGMATMGQYGVKYNVYMAQANKYAKKIKELQADLAKDPYNQDIANQLQEYIEAQQEAILNAEDMKNSIKDMVSDGIDKELDSLQKLIDKRNDALDAAKDLYDYQKKIKESTKDIADLEKQMAAYQGDVSEETKAKIQQIKVDLEEAKSDLEETEYEQYISDQQKMLDDLYNDYETILNQRLDDIDALMADMISEINNNASTIGATIESQADKVGYTLSESMNTIWLSGNGSISSVITMYGTKFDTALTTTNTALGYINTNIQNMITQLNKIAGTKIKAAGVSSAATEKPTPKPSSTPTQQQQQQQQKKQVTVGGTINAGGARIYADSYGNGGGRQTFGSDPIYTVLQERNGYILTRWHKLSSGYTGWFKKSDVSAYALGAKNIRNNEMAWTQENGSEMIMRPSDGAILTPLAKNDSVLTSAASSNIWNMANNPSDFIKDNLDLDKIDTGANVGNKTTYTQNLDKVVFNLPNVKNYDELLKSMQHDKNFERLIMSMTIDPIAGKSSLAKGKAIR